MRDAPDRGELEQAIRAHLASPAPGEKRESTFYVKVTEFEAAQPDSNQLRAGLFLSVPFLGADQTKLDHALARVRRGFKRNEILPGWQIEVSEQKAYSHRDEDLGGAALLTLPAVLTAEPAE